MPSYWDGSKCYLIALENHRLRCSTFLWPGSPFCPPSAPFFDGAGNILNQDEWSSEGNEWLRPLCVGLLFAFVLASSSGLLFAIKVKKHWVLFPTTLRPCCRRRQQAGLVLNIVTLMPIGMAFISPLLALGALASSDLESISLYRRLSNGLAADIAAYSASNVTLLSPELLARVVSIRELLRGIGCYRAPGIVSEVGFYAYCVGAEYCPCSAPLCPPQLLIVDISYILTGLSLYVLYLVQVLELKALQSRRSRSDVDQGSNVVRGRGSVVATEAATTLAMHSQRVSDDLSSQMIMRINKNSKEIILRLTRVFLALFLFVMASIAASLSSLEHYHEIQGGVLLVMSFVCVSYTIFTAPLAISRIRASGNSAAVATMYVAYPLINFTVVQFAAMGVASLVRTSNATEVHLRVAAMMFVLIYTPFIFWLNAGVLRRNVEKYIHV